MGICSSIPVRTDDLDVMKSVICSGFGSGVTLIGMNVELLVEALLSVDLDAKQASQILTLQRKYEKGKLLLEKQQVEHEIGRAHV